MALGFQKFISKVFVNGKFPKILPSENFPLYGMHRQRKLPKVRDNTWLNWSYFLLQNYIPMEKSEI